MARVAYVETALTGGGAGALDAIDGDNLNDGDLAFVYTGLGSDNKLYIYANDSDGGAGESSPTIIVPDANPSDNNWLLQELQTTGLNLDSGTMTLSIADTTELSIATGVITVKDGGKLKSDKIEAYDGAGLYLVEDGGVGLFIADGGNTFLNETANADSTLGFTINQGANDDHILGLKSSDISGLFTTIAEADTYGYGKKVHATNGAFEIGGLGLDKIGHRISAYAGAPDTSAIGVSVSGVSEIVVAQDDGSNGATNCPANSMLFVVRDYDRNKLIIVQSGHIYNDDSAVVNTFDDYDDFHLIDAYEKTKGLTAGEIVSKNFSAFIMENRKVLEESKFVSNGMWSPTMFIQLHNGAIKQNRYISEAISKTLDKLVPGFKEELANQMDSIGINHINVLNQGG